MAEIEVKDLTAKIGEKEILKGINLRIRTGEIHLLMGPNGSGKSTLANVMMGNPKYSIADGKIVFNGEDITNLPAYERAKRGLFLAFQNPIEIEGVNILHFLRTAYKAEKGEGKNVIEFAENIANELNLPREMLKRQLNVNFSGGERKKLELLQAILLDPKIAIFDEIDSGLDIDTLKTVINLLEKIKERTGILLITHSERTAEEVDSEEVHVILDGKIVEEGGKEIIKKIKEKGYASYR